MLMSPLLLNSDFLTLYPCTLSLHFLHKAVSEGFNLALLVRATRALVWLISMTNAAHDVHVRQLLVTRVELCMLKVQLDDQAHQWALKKFRH